MRGSRREDRSCPPEKLQIIEFLGITGSDPLKNHKDTKPAFDLGPLSARQRNAIYMALHMQADYGPLKVVFGSYLPSSTKKIKENFVTSFDPL